VQTSPVESIVQDLHTIATNSDAPDWVTIVASLVATIVGAAAAIVAQYRITHRSELREYRLRLDSEIIKYIESVNSELARLKEDGDRTPGAAIEIPQVDTRAQALWLIARDGDIIVFKELVKTLDRAKKSEDSEQRLIDIRTTANILRAWRNESHDRSKAIERLQGVSLPKNVSD
jgi:hypothetical protein